MVCYELVLCAKKSALGEKKTHQKVKVSTFIDTMIGREMGPKEKAKKMEKAMAKKKKK